jgi:hypothetical protein
MTAGHANVVPASQTAYYSHESAANRTLDDSGSGNNATAGANMTFIAPTITSSVFKLGDTVGRYPRNTSGFLTVPDAVYTDGGFTFTALVLKDGSLLNSGHQTILASDRFRLQWRVDRNTTANTYDVNSQELTMQVRGAAGPTPNTGGSSANGTFMHDMWHFVAIRYNPATNSVNAWIQSTGDTLDAADFTLINLANITDQTGFRIGKDGLSLIGSEDQFHGMIDGARFFSDTLSDAELQQVYASYLAIPEPGALSLLGLAAGTIVRRRRAA